MSRAVRGPVIGILVALALVAAGLAVYVTGRQPASFGWFGYAPLSDAQPVFSGVVVWSRREVVGAALAAAGVVTGAGVLGYVLGRRRGERGAASTEPRRAAVPDRP